LGIINIVKKMEMKMRALAIVFAFAATVALADVKSYKG
jgi:hypothetical protein